ncbi:glycosyltransferase [Ginsengibacter hankyongi]|uniref:Glycosyltransferase n=1 Tax=Ginsengibacter hankyongi TaxID=2607284 RepID=A0A5J5IC46_9BACT|nr:glycosyltransferase [Ginsengibacter hankyongi]KAA9036382.1 glycosyltransferase [Ginsengibacter hankyongi]
MRIVFLTTYYHPFLKSFYDKHTGLSRLSYQEILALLLNEYFADTGALYHYATKHQNQCFLIIDNCEPLQKKWAEENNVNYSEANWAKEIAFAQVKAFRPDVFYLESVFSYFGHFIKEVKTFCRSVVSWISSPVNSSLDIACIDLIISSTPDFVEKFRMQGIKSEYMLPAFDTRIAELLNSSEPKDISFSFVGGLSDVHVNRKRALEKLADETCIQLWGYGYSKKDYKKYTLRYYRNLIVPYSDPIMDAYRGEVWGLEMYKVLQRSLITFNIHESLLKGFVGNMRMFEATGVASMILNDNGKNLPQLFVPGKEIETYDSIDEAIEKVNYFSNHQDEAIAIGKMAQQRTIRDYNYDNFILQLSSYLKKHLS